MKVFFLLFISCLLFSAPAISSEKSDRLSKSCLSQHDGDACWELTLLKYQAHEPGVQMMIELSCQYGSERGCVALMKLKQEQAQQADDDAEIRRMRDLLAIRALAK